jgi:hypothetical protein
MISKQTDVISLPLQPFVNEILACCLTGKTNVLVFDDVHFCNVNHQDTAWRQLRMPLQRWRATQNVFV